MTEVRDKLRQRRAEIETGMTTSARYSMAEAVRKWLEVGLKGRAPTVRATSA
ncbi:MAG: hypothetical protein M3257_01850 [Actinomycetota bacterium]|nr:hypothetical protein [Actinomycetota bacterium]